MSSIYSSEYHFSQHFPLEEKTLLLQKIELMHTQIHELQHRETSLQKINSLLLNALSSNHNIQEKVLTQIKVLNASHDKSHLIQNYEQQLAQLREEILRLKTALSNYHTTYPNQGTIKNQTTFVFKPETHRNQVENTETCLKSEHNTNLKQENVFLEDYTDNKNFKNIDMEMKKVFKSKNKNISYRESSDLQKYCLVPGTPQSVMNSCNFRKQKHKRRLSERVYEIEIKEKENKSFNGRKSSAEIVKLIQEKEFIQKQIENCQRKCNENIQTHIDSIVCIVKNRNSSVKPKGFSKEGQGVRVQKQAPLEKKGSQRKTVLCSDWDERIEKFKTPRYAKKLN